MTSACTWSTGVELWLDAELSDERILDADKAVLSLITCVSWRVLSLASVEWKPRHHQPEYTAVRTSRIYCAEIIVCGHDDVSHAAQSRNHSAYAGMQ